MKLCIPTMGNRGMDEIVGEHFGRVPTYTIVDPDSDEVTVIENNTMHMGGTGYAPDLISKAGAEVMLCGGLGRRAIGLFEQSGIKVYVGASGTVRDAVRMFNDGKLIQATDETACQQHAFRGEGTGDGHGHHHHH
ncbi:MAG: NifB/NifX family molybdenum-iron cluster-binding protein [Candidatus Thermoplasmatota archaeon]|nr:NifB/NifX family molybdenum-iron cluster-binding protein [Candidatus Thermoplasmatota archaeon]